MTRRSSSPLLFTVAEAAETLGMGRSTLYAAIKSGSCPLTVTRIGKRIRIPRAALERLAGDRGSSDGRAHDDHAFLRELCPTCGRSSSSSRPTNSAAFWSSSVTASV
ncbi:MAG: helix-turn-helix domain-containing protein [Acidimicrobiales bacterium]